MMRTNAAFAFGVGIFAALSGSALAQQQPAAPAASAAAPPPAAAPAADPNAQQFSINQNVGDWVVRCVLTTVKSPAPCEVMQTTVNKDSQQRISSFSIAYVPSRESYAMQVVVPAGVALAKGLTLAPALNAAKFTRCERDGCYVEMLIDNATVTSLGNAGKSASIAVFGYGQDKQITLPVSMTGFPEAMDRMKSLAKDRAVALPPNGSPLPPAPPAVGPGAAKPAGR